MKARTLVLTGIFLLVVAVIFIFASCDNGGVTPTYIGTWINPDYDGTVEGGNAGKSVVTHVSGNDYMCTMYDKYDDTAPAMTVPFTVTTEWTDSEGNLFAESISYPPDPEVFYSLGKVHADNQTMESNGSEVGYPTEIDPAGEEYSIMYRP